MSIAISDRYLSMQDLVQGKATDPIWVINITHTLEDHMPSDVFITITTPDGGSTPITLNRSWLPVRLTDQVPRSHVLNSRHFMKALGDGIIRAISPEYAEELQNRSDAPAEKNRLEQASKAVVNATKAARVERPENRISMVGVEGTALATDKPEIVGAGRRINENSNAAISFDMGDTEEVKDPNQVSDEFKEFVNELSSVTEADARTQLAERGSFSPAEILWMSKKIQHASIKKWATDKARDAGVL